MLYDIITTHSSEKTKIYIASYKHYSVVFVTLVAFLLILQSYLSEHHVTQFAGDGDLIIISLFVSSNVLR